MLNQQIPPHITKYFWGDNLDQLSVQKNKTYIIQTILEKGDQKAIKWLFSTIDKQAVKSSLHSIRLDKKSNHFWHIYLS